MNRPKKIAVTLEEVEVIQHGPCVASHNCVTGCLIKDVTNQYSPSSPAVSR
jgi:hypothetical protein